MQSAGDRLLGLVVVTVVAVGAVALLLRLSDRRQGDSGPIQGYPPNLFPAQHLTASGALAALAGTQQRLFTMYSHLPAGRDAAIWLGTFLHELREIMDTAYRVALATEVYGHSAALERLVAEVRSAEREFAQHVARRLLQRDGDSQNELLAGRLATLRLCVRELALLHGDG